MALDGQFVILAYLNFDRYHFAAAEQLEDGGVEHRRSAMGEPRLYDHLGAYLPDQLLHHYHVVWELDYGHTEPSGFVHELVLSRDLGPQLGHKPQAFFAVYVDLGAGLVDESCLRRSRF